MTVVVAVGLRREARLLARHGVTIVIGGGDSSRLEAELGTAARAATGLISIGIAGALGPGLRVGDWVVAAAVQDGAEVIATDAAWAARLRTALHGPTAGGAESGRSARVTAARATAARVTTGIIVGSDAVIGGADCKASLHARTGAIAVDMESHVVARVARRHGKPFAAVRVVSDAANRALPHAARVGMRPDGSPDLPAVLRSLLTDPRQLPALLRVALDAERAFRALLRGGRRLGRGLAGDPDPP